MSSWAGFASSPRTRIQESSRGRTAVSPTPEASRTDCVSTPRPRLSICVSSCGSRLLFRQAGRELHEFSDVSLLPFGPRLLGGEGRPNQPIRKTRVNNPMKAKWAEQNRQLGHLNCGWIVGPAHHTTHRRITVEKPGCGARVKGAG